MANQVSAAGFFLSRIDDGKRSWLLLKNAKRGDWGFPKGHCNKGEGLVQCALRECAEETAIAFLEITGEAYEISYRVNANQLKAVYYYPAETEQTEVVLSKEHSEARWFSHAEVIKHLSHASTQSIFEKFVAAEVISEVIT